MAATRGTLRGDETLLARVGQQAMRVERLRPREREVLRLGVSGLDNASIAARLGLAPQTVVNYWQVIYTLLGLVGREDRRHEATELWRAWCRR